MRWLLLIFIPAASMSIQTCITSEKRECLTFWQGYNLLFDLGDRVQRKTDVASSGCGINLLSRSILSDYQTKIGGRGHD